MPPSPGVRHLRSDVWIARPPAKLMARARGIGNQTRRITGPPRADLHGKLTAGDFPDIGDQLPDRPATPGTKIERATLRAVEQRPHRFDVSIREIAYVDVVTDTGAVGGGIIVAENREARAFSRRCIEQERNDMRSRERGTRRSRNRDPAPAALK